MTPATPADRTPQEQLWAGEFGNDYIVRNRDSDLIESNRALFEKILSHTQGVTSAIEFGANIGNNLHALHELMPAVELHSVEINASAAAEIQAWGGCHRGGRLTAGLRALTSVGSVLHQGRPDSPAPAGAAGRLRQARSVLF